MIGVSGIIVALAILIAIIFLILILGRPSLSS
jgi:uncharacterized protein YoxC